MMRWSIPFASAKFAEVSSAKSSTWRDAEEPPRPPSVRGETAVGDGASPWRETGPLTLATETRAQRSWQSRLERWPAPRRDRGPRNGPSWDVRPRARQLPVQLRPPPSTLQPPPAPTRCWPWALRRSLPPPSDGPCSCRTGEGRGRRSAATPGACRHPNLSTTPTGERPHPKTLSIAVNAFPTDLIKKKLKKPLLFFLLENMVFAISMIGLHLLEYTSINLKRK